METEIHFGYMKDERFMPLINENHYKNLNEILNSYDCTVTKTYTFTVSYSDNTRVRQYMLKNEKFKEKDKFLYPWYNGKVYQDEIVSKINQFKTFLPEKAHEYLTRLHVSKESEKDSVPEISKAIYYRTSIRLSFIINHEDFKGIRVDLDTFKYSNTLDSLMGTEEILYSIETEALDGCTEDNLRKVSPIILEIIDSIDYAKYAYESIVNKNRFIGNNVLSFAIDERINKITSGMLSLKLDGERMLLMCIDGFVWSITKKLHFKRIFMTSKIPSVTIIDCEYFKGSYSCFDVLFYDNIDVRNQPFIQRYGYLSERGNGQGILDQNMTLKHFFDCGEHYIEHMNNLIHSTSSFDKESVYDGIILMDKYSKYNNSSCFKWKPKCRITFDFMLELKGKSAFLLTSDMKRFTSKYMTRQATLDQNYTGVELHDKDIVECEYLGNSLFTAIRVRSDKEKGNHVTVLEDNMSLLHADDIISIKYNSLNKNRMYDPCFNFERFKHWLLRYNIKKVFNRESNILFITGSEEWVSDISKLIDAGIRDIYVYISRDNEAKNKLDAFIEKIRKMDTYKYFNVTLIGVEDIQTLQCDNIFIDTTRMPHIPGEINQSLLRGKSILIKKISDNVKNIKLKRFEVICDEKVKVSSYYDRVYDDIKIQEYFNHSDLVKPQGFTEIDFTKAKNEWYHVDKEQNVLDESEDAYTNIFSYAATTTITNKSK